MTPEEQLQLNSLLNHAHSLANRANKTPDLSEIVQELSVIFRFNPASGARLVFEVIRCAPSL